MDRLNCGSPLNDTQRKSEVAAPLSSRREFLHAAAATGGGAILSAAFVPATAGASTDKGAELVLPSATKTVTPFEIHVPAAALDDLTRRLANTRWPDKEPVADWSQGVPLAKARALVDYWRTRYDWRRLERSLNALPQFRTQLDGLGIHFIHVRSKHPDALPVILTHGWPGSVIEFLQVIAPLVDPTAHGGDSDDAFHVVIPSLPGFGFSDKPTEPGWGLPRIAEAWGVLMQRLGYTRYVAQGGDWGAGVTSWMAKQQPSGLAAVHLNLPILFPPPPPPPGGYSAEEQATLAQMGRYSTDAFGYASIQGTRPQTLGYGLADSPAGQGMWIYEKFQGWTDNHGNPEDALSIDAMLDDINLYWFTDTAASSARLYFESFRNDFVRMPLELPVAVSIFKGELFRPPRVWGERTYSKLFYWNAVPKGGHFAAFEQPELFVSELRKAFRQMRRGLGDRRYHTP